MEYLLNILWLLVASALFALVCRHRVRGQLRCSLPLALGCAALVALLLFPALSMTDDLLRAKLDMETAGRHLGDTVPMDAFDGSVLPTVEAFSLSLILLLLAARMAIAGRLTRTREALPWRGRVRARAEAVRPPPRHASICFA